MYWDKGLMQLSMAQMICLCVCVFVWDLQFGKIGHMLLQSWRWSLITYSYIKKWPGFIIRVPEKFWQEVKLQDWWGDSPLSLQETPLSGLRSEPCRNTGQSGAAILKACVPGPLGSPSTFQGVQEVKAICLFHSVTTCIDSANATEDKASAMSALVNGATSNYAWGAELHTTTHSQWGGGREASLTYECLWWGSTKY